MKKVHCDTRSCFFCQSSSAEWLELTRLKKQTFLFKRGEQVFKEGEPLRGMYFMLSGAAKVHRQWGGKELLIRFTSPGDVLGVRGFTDAVYRVSATALEESKVCLIPLDHLEASLRINPSLSNRLMHYYASELDQAEKRMSDLAHRDVKGRLVEALLMLSQKFGKDEENFLAITLSRQDLASYAGTSYETVFKIFTEWISSGWIKTDGKRIGLLNEDALQAFI